MEALRNPLGRLAGFIHRHFLFLLLAAYAAAAAWPGPGVAAKGITLAQVAVPHEHVSLTLPMVLLAGLLFGAGLGADASEVARVARRPLVVLSGLAMNLLVPLVFLLALIPVLRLWHDPDEVQSLLLGLAVVAAMPIAGSSTAWSQNANGSAALSLGLVVLSTLLSPVTTPLTLRAVGAAATGEYAAALRQLSGRGTGVFLVLCVVLPSLVGMLARWLLGGERASRLKRGTKLFNSLALLFLCYANAATALPQMVAEPDWDFLAFIAMVAIALCLSAFAAGWLLAWLLQADPAEQRSLMFGLGMNNNGTGLVLACAALPALPMAVLPVLAYNLAQHLVAGGVYRSLQDPARVSSTRPAAAAAGAPG